MGFHAFCSCDLDLDPMTLIYELDLKILKMYLLTRNELSRSRVSNVRALQVHRHTDTQVHRQMQPNILLCGIRGWQIFYFAES